MRELMDAGVDSTTASELLYGVVGANTDTRDWDAIMASGDVVSAARQATAEMYSNPEATSETIKRATSDLELAGTSQENEYSIYGSGSGQPSIVETENGYAIVAGNGLALRGGYNSLEAAQKAGLNFGISADSGVSSGSTSNTSGSGTESSGSSSSSSSSNTINVGQGEASAIQRLADLIYLSQNTGVSTTVLNEAKKAAGIDITDPLNYQNTTDLLAANGYSPGYNENFYGDNAIFDTGAQILYERWQNAPTDEELIEAGLNPDDFVVVNNNVANQTYLQNKLQEMGGGSTNASFTNLNEGQTIEQNRLDFDEQLQGTTNPFWSKYESPSTAALDMLEWDLLKKEKEKDKDSTTSTGSTATITGGTSNTPGGGQIVGGDTGIGVNPVYTSTPNIGNITPVYGQDQTGLTEVDIPTYEAGLGLQQTQFENRAQQQQQYYQPQTLAEQEAAGNAPAFENRLYRNKFGMSMYIQFLRGPDGTMRPTQPIPQGYYEVQGFGQQVQAQNQGGVIPKQTNIAGQPHRLAYVNPQEEKLLKAAGGAGVPSYGGVPAYFTLGPGTTVGEVAVDPTTGTKYTWNGTTWNVQSGGSSSTVNPAMNFKPGGTVVEEGGKFKIKYPDGTYSQDYGSSQNAKAALDMGTANLGLPSYSDYLTSQGYNQSLPGFDNDAIYSAYQSYISDPATLTNIQNQQAIANQPEVDPAKINQDFVSGEQEVTKDDLAQYQRNLAAQAYAAPGGAVAASPVSYIDPNVYGSVIESTAGQALGTAPMVQENQVAQIGSATTADTPQKTGAGQMTANQAYSDVKTATDGMTAATSTGPTKTIDAAQQTGTSVSGLTGATGESVDVTDAPTRTEKTGEMIDGSTVDQAQVAAAFGTGEAQAASVQGELANLMSQFEGGETPAWAAGSMRAASAMLAARGLSASSMAGQAVIQAAMESALPIAQIDASNKQQMALFKAEQRAKFLQMDFDQAFQAKVMNAAKVSEIANMNFTAQQQIALENSKAANTMALQNLTNEQALVMAEAAALSQMDAANLNNRQQAAVQNAQNFLQVDMANLANSQQTALFKQQSLINTILSDQAAANAAQQFNATSQNQTDQFFANLSASVNQFNAAQINAMKQFNADEVNALLEFNAGIQNQREMFNAQNYLVVAQANAQWRQNLATINTAAANESNMDYAQTVNGLTVKTLDEIWQRERDLMDYSFTQSENAADRALSILLGDKQLSAVQQQLDSQEDQALGTLLTKVFFSSDFKSIFD